MKDKRTKVLISFYSVGNFGDDFFIKLIGENVPEADFYLMYHPKYPIYGLPSNVKVMKVRSLIVCLFGKLFSVLEKHGLQDSKIGNILQKLIMFILNKNKKRFSVFVEIGGSIFMQDYGNQEEKDFTVAPEIIRDYSITCKNKEESPYSFVIGANFGPFNDENYCLEVEKILVQKTAVCLRDYSSYCMFKHLENVQYAPDVVFTYVPDLKIGQDTNKKRALISLIDPGRYKSRKIREKEYYDMINDAIKSLLERDFLIDLVSFCESEGDMEAVRKVLSNFENCSSIKVHNYKGVFDNIIEVFKKSDFVIASRFHSMVLGFIFQKPVFPIAYNCKTINYLADLNFKGKYACNNNVSDITSDDVLYNYDNKIICDITQHRKYAKNQFYPLKQFLRERNR